MNDRAVTAKQKKEIIKRLYQLWLENPQLRLGQLIGNVYHFPSGVDPYYDEDHILIENLESYYRDAKQM